MKAIPLFPIAVATATSPHTGETRHARCGLAGGVMPIYPAGNTTAPASRTLRVHPHLQLWFVEGRNYCSRNTMPGDPDKNVPGAEQRDWLQRALKESDASWKVIITTTSPVGPGRDSRKDNHPYTRGLKDEAGRIFVPPIENSRSKT